MSREYSNFSLPVCTSFKRRLLDGQLCYQIDVNTIINETTAAGLQKGGLSLLVDANAEYDLTSLWSKTIEEEIFDDFTEEFFKAEESEMIMIHIETISKAHFPFLAQYSKKDSNISRFCPYEAVRRGELRHH